MRPSSDQSLRLTRAALARLLRVPPRALDHEIVLPGESLAT